MAKDGRKSAADIKKDIFRKCCIFFNALCAEIKVDKRSGLKRHGS